MINGYNHIDGVNKVYRPGDAIKRMHTAVLLHRVNDLTVPSNVDKILKSYKDNGKIKMYRDEIASTYDSGIFTGSNGNFMGDKNLTREQMATVLVNAYHLGKFKKMHLLI